MAAGILLVREAGGLIEPFNKDMKMIESGSVIAATGPMFDRFAKIIRND